MNYRWVTDTSGFSMPVEFRIRNEEWSLLYPSNEWQRMEVEHIRSDDFKVNTNRFYVAVTINGRSVTSDK